MVEIARILNESPKEFGCKRGVGRYSHVKLHGGIEGVVEILQMRDGTAFGIEIALNHAMTVQVQHPTFGETSA